MTKIISCYGGLGDNLSLSTLPEAFHKQGHDVYISNRNVYRNNEIYDLVWKSNPYVKGVSDGEPNCGFVHNVPNYKKGFIRSIEEVNGVNSGSAVPVIYYKPKIVPEYVGRTVLQLSGITAQYTSEEIFDLLHNLPRIVSRYCPIEIHSTYNVNEHGRYLYGNDHKEYDIYSGNKKTYDSIYDLCDIIHTCDNFVTLHSGASVLASALNKNNTFVLMNEALKNIYEENNFIFDNINYIF